jgi:hypothetical protein
MKIKSKSSDWVLSWFNKLHGAIPDSEPNVVRKLRGKPKSNTVLLCPPCSAEDYKNGVPFSNRIALIFHGILLSEVGFDTDAHSLVVPCSLYGAKANKASTTPMAEFSAKLAEQDRFTRFICVGDDTFKFLFAHGKKAGMKTLGGAVIRVPQTCHKPLFVFPSIEGLAPEFKQDEGDWKLKRWQEQTQIEFRRYLIKFRLFLESTNG